MIVGSIIGEQIWSSPERLGVPQTFFRFSIVGDAGKISATIASDTLCNHVHHPFRIVEKTVPQVSRIASESSDISWTVASHLPSTSMGEMFLVFSVALSFSTDADQFRVKYSRLHIPFSSSETTIVSPPHWREGSAFGKSEIGGFL